MELKMNNDAIIAWVRTILGYDVDEEVALSMYHMYRCYRDEGQSDIVSKQYAGLL